MINSLSPFRFIDAGLFSVVRRTPLRVASTCAARAQSLTVAFNETRSRNNLAGALIGPVMGLGGYASTFWWLKGRESAYKAEMVLAFVIGALPGFGLQFLLQKILRKRPAAG